uniref:Phosphatidic acid phosphatase type 2/haloperoxidase domain-containing protein n=2 Tax=Physcomitrium patens TaxID=3218 RepID=A9TH33_PHYPA
MRMERLLAGDMAMASGDVAANLVNAQYDGFTNFPIVAAFLSFFVAQSLKVLTTWYKENRWDVKRLYGSGGMPSSHSATVTGLACAIGLREGLGGPLFAIAFVLACIVMYDASGVRLQAGRQAEVLNQIVFELPPEHPLSDSRPLKEFLGHTPPQVAAGAMLGCLIAYTLHLLSLVGPST